MNSGLTDKNNNVIKIQLNIDGIPLYNSSSIQFWPILARSLNFINKEPFVIAIYSGTAKPEPLSEYLNSFVEETMHLLNSKFKYLNKTYEFEVECFTCDAPARSYLKQIKGHNSKSACERCTVTSLYENKKHFYPTRDPMYLIYLGVVKRLLVMYWIEGKRPMKIPKFSLQVINNKIRNMKKIHTNRVHKKN
ncbi:hypothetical protein NQ315_008760 [Exocentrus adspersus]|uniref:Transposase n=1 Tax=Exocentrus adspersus TaxID=1586481 RepID=A0AAV8VGQ7_9CUCU|nr:hypothetical protein NQ315_008760 [Exocentrus adspersus]